ncbi:fimbrial protein precursor [bacterium BMS3Bbin08]|nr:fimbrial protein precursor [bacterium BMS3Bbin08]
MKRNGFTLIELLVAMSIVAILAAISLSAYVGVSKRADRSEAYTNLEALKLLEDQFFADAGRYPNPSGITCAKDRPQNVGYIRQGGSTADSAEALPNFRPGAGGNFSYCIENNIDFNGAALVPCFRARAFGNSDTRVDGDTFAIDCDNERNF